MSEVPFSAVSVISWIVLDPRTYTKQHESLVTQSGDGCATNLWVRDANPSRAFPKTPPSDRSTEYSGAR